MFPRPPCPTTKFANVSRFLRLIATATTLAFVGCKQQAPWSGQYVLDLSSGVQATLTRMNEAAEDRGVALSSTQPTTNALLLTLEIDGKFKFERALLGSRTVSTGTYVVQDGRIVLTVIEDNGVALEQPRTHEGSWSKSEIALDGWGVLRRGE